MAVYVYEPGEHPAGFVGVRVIRRNSLINRQRYLSFKDNGKLLNKRQQKQLIAQGHELDRRWANEYQSLLNTTRIGNKYCNVKPCRESGIYGITLQIAMGRKPSGNRYAYPGFRVARGRGTNGQKHFGILAHGYGDAWRRAVDQWAEVYAIDREMKTKALRLIPEPQLFANLIARMEYEKHDLPDNTQDRVDEIFRLYRDEGHKRKPRNQTSDLEERIRAAVRQHLAGGKTIDGR